MTRLLAALLGVALLAGPAGSRAADDAADAKARFRKGAELYRAGKWREAIGEFEAAYRLKPHGAIHFNVAQCREKLQEWPGALRAYEDYLREVPEAKDRAAVRASMKKIEERLAAAGVQALLVYTDPPGAELTLDGRPRGKTPFHTVLPPGSYALALALDGYERVAEDVTVAPGASRVLDLVLRPAPAPAAGAAAAPRPGTAPDLKAAAPAATAVSTAPAAPASRAKKRVYTWIAAGAAAVAGAAGAYFGWSASQDEDALKSMTDPNGSQAQKYADGATSNSKKANALYAVAGGAAAAGVTLFFVEKKF